MTDSKKTNKLNKKGGSALILGLAKSIYYWLQDKPQALMI